ncbi:Serine/threonine-protein kinase [Drechslerella dactyloides]|uniref:Serine/threonine-protein kinase n=1 Tax=Drechslerella dactyloides TaxID=74499 RepID=A0AAD6J3A1_DREDA|nr:Serine/threonine-protein kinase [Drechslerella dactyloides]
MTEVSSSGSSSQNGGRGSRRAQVAIHVNAPSADLTNIALNLGPGSFGVAPADINLDSSPNGQSLSSSLDRLPDAAVLPAVGGTATQSQSSQFQSQTRDGCSNSRPPEDDVESTTLSSPSLPLHDLPRPPASSSRPQPPPAPPASITSRSSVASAAGAGAGAAAAPPPRLIFEEPHRPYHHRPASTSTSAAPPHTDSTSSTTITTTTTTNPSFPHHHYTPNSFHHHPPDLHLQTSLAMASSNNTKSIPVPSGSRPSAAALSRSNSFQSSLSPASAAGSPSMGGFLSEITPLPSPVITADSPGPWRLFRNGSISSRPTSRGSIASLSVNEQADHHHHAAGGEPTPAGVGRSPSKRKLYQGLNFIDAPMHDLRALPSSSRSVSEQVGNYKIEVPTISRQSQTEEAIHEKSEEPTTKDAGSTAASAVVNNIGVAAAAASAAPSSSTVNHPFKREEHLAGKHGQQRTRSTADLQVPGVDGFSEYRSIPEEGMAREIFTATTYPGNNLRRWRAVRLLGQGTFSKVMLATLELKKDTDSEAELDRDKLVAVKIVENTAAGGASRARIESSLKRELDILKSIKHPSLVHLKAQSIERKRALLVLGYCAGGDLFDLATSSPKLLTPRFVRRIFAELVGAVRYLHLSGIVHRDIKLENVLINFTAEELVRNGEDILMSNRSITTLTDLGLSRRIDIDEPLLTTRCGSEDYAAPELLLGQPYDGRQTDAWALGVLLYAICEARLPFDPVPGANEHKMRSRTAHRIARCDWKWFRLADTPAAVQEEDGAAAAAAEVREAYDPAWNPAKEVVDGLLRRVKKRVPLEEVEKTEWVRGAIAVPLENPPSTEELEEDDDD